LAHVAAERAHTAAAIDSLGAGTILCPEKTGALTLNRMSVERLLSAGNWCSIAIRPRVAIPAVLLFCSFAR
jgi:magnesium-transporting ATPase (P-type)